MTKNIDNLNNCTFIKNIYFINYILIYKYLYKYPKPISKLVKLSKELKPTKPSNEVT